jgi:hypothetical protein
MRRLLCFLMGHKPGKAPWSSWASRCGCTCTLTMTSSRLPSCHARILFPNHGPPFFHACLADDAITRPGQSRYEVPRIALFKPI